MAETPIQISPPSSSPHSLNDSNIRPSASAIATVPTMGCTSSKDAEESTVESRPTVPLPISAQPHQNRPSVAPPKRQPSGTSNACAEPSHLHFPYHIGGDHPPLYFAVDRRRNERGGVYHPNPILEEQAQPDPNVHREIYETEERYQGNTVNAVIRRKVVEYGSASRPPYYFRPDCDNLTAHNSGHLRPTGLSRPTTSAPLLSPARHAADEGLYGFDAEGSVLELSGYSYAEDARHAT